MTDVEAWRPVAEAPLYEVSNLGNIRSWHPWRGRPTPRMLHPSAGSDGYLQIRICSPGSTPRVRSVHVLVAAAFLGQRPEGAEVRHLDGNPKRNLLINLAYGSRAENQQDAVRHGTHASVAKRACKHGREFTPDNVYLHGGKRQCRECRRRTWPERNARRRSARMALGGRT